MLSTDGLIQKLEIKNHRNTSIKYTILAQKK